MNQSREAFAAALSSGETERVNSAIDEIEEMELEEQAGIFDECFDMCRDLYQADEGYQRQSVIRFASKLYPRLALRTVGKDLTDDALPGEWTLKAIATHRGRLRDLYLDALVDDDGRVRRAAAKAIKDVALSAELIGADEELQTMLEELDVLAEDCGAAKRKHVDQAHESVAFHAGKPGSLLPNGIQDALEQEGSSKQ